MTRTRQTRAHRIGIAVLTSLTFGCSGILGQSNSDPEVTTVVAAGVSTGEGVSLLSAFYGLDYGLPLLARFVVCGGALGSDGMPVVFSEEVDVTTVEAGDFRIVLEDGGGYIEHIGTGEKMKVNIEKNVFVYQVQMENGEVVLESWMLANPLLSSFLLSQRGAVGLC